MRNLVHAGSGRCASWRESKEGEDERDDERDTRVSDQEARARRRRRHSRRRAGRAAPGRGAGRGAASLERQPRVIRARADRVPGTRSGEAGPLRNASMPRSNMAPRSPLAAFCDRCRSLRVQTLALASRRCWASSANERPLPWWIASPPLQLSQRAMATST